MEEMYNKSEEELQRLSELGMQHVENNFKFDNFKSRWVEIVGETIEKYGSWEGRKNYKRWTLGEVK